jgi:outer membrane protein OmpA-like peptidoglycan-associated protein
VRIEGHTDSQGSDKFNLKLSQQRAASVRTYLITKGTDPARMVAEGFGERVPIADNRTSGGRAQNRRVEFVITSK